VGRGDGEGTGRPDRPPHGGAIGRIPADGRWLASGGEDGTVWLWDVARRRPQAELVGHQRPVQSVAFTPGGGALATAGADGTVGLWGVADGALRARLDGFPAIVLYVAFTADGRALVTASAGQLLGKEQEGEVRRWDLASVLGADG
jgi:WD40 repeat protein